MKLRLTEHSGIKAVLAFANSKVGDAIGRHEAAVEASRLREGFRPEWVHAADVINDVHKRLTALLELLVEMSEGKAANPPPWADAGVAPYYRLAHMEFHALHQIRVMKAFRDLEEAHPNAATILEEDLCDLSIDRLESGLCDLIIWTFQTPVRVLRCGRCGQFTIEDRVIRSPKAKARRWCSEQCRRKGDYAERKLAGYWRKYRSHDLPDALAEQEALNKALFERQIWPGSERAEQYREALARGERSLAELLEHVEQA